MVLLTYPIQEPLPGSFFLLLLLPAELAPSLAAARVAVTHLQALQRAVAAPVIHGDADGGSQLAGDASLLQVATTHASNSSSSVSHHPAL
jgi:hypothetical protein